MRLLVLALLLPLSCAKSKTPPADPGDVEIAALEAEFGIRCEQARDAVDADGWLLPDDGDGMLWSGLLGATRCAIAFDPTAAEYPTEPGRFDRAPPPGSIVGGSDAWSSWSRDMQKGLLWYAWRTGPAALPMLERHIAYGRAQKWRMGKPFGDGRSYYTPAAIGLTFQVAWGIGGADDKQRFWPDIYPSGLVDYQAHIQVKNIMLRAEIEAAKPEADPPKPDDPIVDEGDGDLGLMMDVTDAQLARLMEHAEREPACGFYRAALARYDGSYARAVDALLAEGHYCSYVRCDDLERCKLADWLFSADLVLRAFP